jgi:molecular chaperone DnaJ
MKLRVGGEGEAGERGSYSGDLYIIVHVKEHKLFSRDGSDLYLKTPVSFVTAALGGEIKVRNIYGEEEAISIPAGTSSGAVFQLRSSGMPNLNGYGKGILRHALAEFLEGTRMYPGCDWEIPMKAGKP